MKVLVFAKRTQLDMQGEYIRRRVSEKLIDPTYLFRAQEAHEQHHQTLTLLHKCLSANSVQWTDVSPGRYWPDTSQFDAVIAVGGDGTVLQAARHVIHVPLIGVRSANASVGYLCAANLNNVEEILSNLGKKLKTLKLSRFRACIHHVRSHSQEVTEPILNDVLFCNLSPAAATRYRLKVGEQAEEQVSSGIWISTAAGSTAAIHAAGGQKMDLDQERLQYLVREPYCRGREPYQLLNSFAKAENITIENLSPESLIAVDGTPSPWQLDYGDRVELSQAEPLFLASSI